MRYTFLGDKLTDDRLRGMQCDPVRRADGKCVVSIKMATALVVDADGVQHVVPRRRLRRNDKLMAKAEANLRQAWHEARTGQTRPIDELWKDLE
jgi:ribosomal protein S17